MYELFEDVNHPKHPTVKPGQIDLLRRTYKREVQKVIDYYGSRVYSIDNNHILNRMIVTGCPAVRYDLQKFTSAIKTRAPSLAAVYELTSSEKYGKVRSGNFYGGTMEILLHDSSDFDEEQVYANWRYAEPVKVLTHPFSDYKLVLPDGKKYTSKDGLLTVLSINISMLMVQYKAFVDSRIALNDEDRMRLGSAHFIKMHVLPNILKSQVELVLYNRLKNQFYGIPGHECEARLPFPIIDYTSIADDIAKEYIDRFADKPMSYAQVLQSIPGIYKSNMLDTLCMPDEAKTKQVWWALFLTRLEDMFFLMHLLGDRGMKNNTRYYEKMVTSCRFFLRDNSFKKVVSESIYRGYLSDMKDIEKGY